MLVLVIDTWGGAFQFARSRPPWFAALFLFRVALLRPVSSQAASVQALFKRSPSTGLFQTIFPYRVKLGYVVSGDLSQSATLRQRDRDTTPRPGFSRDPLPLGGASERRHALLPKQ